jgi:hypothetical protein
MERLANESEQSAPAAVSSEFELQFKHVFAANQSHT